MRAIILFLVIPAFLLMTGCNGDNDTNDGYDFLHSESFTFNTEIVPTSLTQEESFYITSPITEIVADPGFHTIETDNDLEFFNVTHIRNSAEYISFNDLATYTYFFILDPGCPDFFDYSDHSYSNSQLTITLDHFHERGVVCPAMIMELYMVFKARKST